MPTLKDAAEEFLSLKRIAVAGVSSSRKAVGNYIYDKLIESGYETFAINPSGKEIDGKPSYTDLAATPSPAEGVVLATPPKASLEVVKECARLGIKHVWIHKSVDNGSYSREAEDFCHQNGINIIPMGCPMMFLQPVDLAHKCIKWFLHTFGKMPKSY